MPVGRWVILVVWISVSLLLSLGTLIWALIVPEARQGIRLPSILQLLEIGLAIGLFLMADWAHRWAVRWYLVKAVYCACIGIGIAIGGGWSAQHIVLFGLAAFWGCLVLFLWWNREYFD